MSLGDRPPAPQKRGFANASASSKRPWLSPPAPPGNLWVINGARPHCGKPGTVGVGALPGYSQTCPAIGCAARRRLASFHRVPASARRSPRPSVASLHPRVAEPRPSVASLHPHDAEPRLSATSLHPRDAEPRPSGASPHSRDADPRPSAAPLNPHDRYRHPSAASLHPRDAEPRLSVASLHPRDAEPRPSVASRALLRRMAAVLARKDALLRAVPVGLGDACHTLRFASTPLRATRHGRE
jgi:hypothetical protein